MAYLPELVLRKLFSYLSVQDLLNVGDVCRRWRNVQRDQCVWRNSKFICDDTLPLNEILHVLEHASSLEILCIDRSRDLEVILDKVPITCFNIRKLVFRISISEKQLEIIAHNCKKIKVLELRCIDEEASPEGIIRVISMFSNLRRLFMCCLSLTNSPRIIVDGFPYLEELYIIGATILDSELLCVIEQRKERLRVLIIDGHMLTQGCLWKLSELKSLRALTLYRCKTMDMNIAQTIRNLHLLSLGFPCNPTLTSNIMHSILTSDSMHNLKLINVSCCDLLDDSFARDVALFCPVVEHLNLCKCTGITESGLALIIERCNKLKALNIVGLPYTRGNVLELIPVFLKSLKWVRLGRMFEDEERASRVRQFLDTVPSLLPELLVINLSAFGFVDDAFPEYNSDWFYLWSSL